MRKPLLVFLMMLLPLQWTAALAADCCARHDAQSQEQPAQMHGDHHGHGMAHHDSHHASPDDGKPAKADCQMDCSACSLHHSAAVVIDVSALPSLPPVSLGDTPYLASITSPTPDNLFRPPLAVLA